MEMETSDEEAEDGQISKLDQEEEKERKLLGKTVEPMTIADLNKVRLTRDVLAKHFLVPWFKEYVKGATSAVFFLALLDDSCQERMCVILWEWTNIVFMRFVVRADSPLIYIR
jgi:hypothetical protein